MNSVIFVTAIGAEVLLIAALNWFDDFQLETMPVRFVFGAFAAGIACFLALRVFRSITAHRTAVLWSIAILLRLVALSLQPGDDFWRYQWEGRIQRAGFNPYVVAPDDPQLARIAEQFPMWSKINHREWRAIYPPGAQLTFRALSRLSEQPLLWKLVFVAADLALLALLLRLVKQRADLAALYAWNPLVVYSFAGAAHFDSLMLLPLTAAVLFLVRQDDAVAAGEKWNYALAASLCFGLAISFKLVPLLLLPIAAFALGKRAPVLLISLAIPAALATIYGWPRIDIWNSLGEFARVTRLNDLFWWISETFVWANPRQKNVLYNRMLIGVVLGLSFAFCRNWRRGMLWVVGAALILSPVMHPWYCTWILPFAAWREARAWFVLSITLFAYYFFWNERLFALPWHGELWQRMIIIVPPLAVLVLTGRRVNRESRALLESR